MKKLNYLCRIVMTFLLCVGMNANMFVSVFAVTPDENAVKYTLQVYLHFESVDKSGYPGSSTLQFINTSSILETDSYETTHSLENYGTFSKNHNNLPQNESWNMDSYYISLASDGSLLTKKEFVPLFMDQQTTFNQKPSIVYMSPLQDKENETAPGYTLSQVWVYQPKKDETNWEKENEYIDTTLLSDEDFVIYNVPSKGKDVHHDTTKIYFTDKADDADLTIPGTGDTYYNNLSTYTTEEDGQKVVKESTEEDGSYTILIQNGTVIRLAYDTISGTYEESANFFDYDISEGATFATGTIGFPGRGINSHENYTEGTGTVKFAFGNANTGTGLGKTQYLSSCKESSGYLTLNAYNNCNMGGLTYSLVNSLKYGTDGLPVPVWNSKIKAPDLFSTKTVKGKTVYVNTGKKNSTYYNIVFLRQGGTLTLESVKKNTINGSGKTSSTTAVQNLNKFRNTYINKDGTAQGKTINGNSFWPLDTAPSAGTSGHDPLFGDTDQAVDLDSDVETEKNNELSAFNFPPSDDSLNHNSYFGMSYDIDFNVQPGYIAPLNYWFYGDDDMWVFLQKLDSKGKPTGEAELIADVGGVHSSVGVYVNLWDWIKPIAYTDANGKENKSQSYRLTVFYTERGASGSSAYMRFKLPTGFDSINNANTPVVPNTGDSVMNQVALLGVSILLLVSVCFYRKHQLSK